MITDEQINRHIDRIDILRDNIKSYIKNAFVKNKWILTDEEKKILMEYPDLIDYAEEKLKSYNPVNEIRQDMILKAIALWLLNERIVKKSIEIGIEWSALK